MHDLDIEIPDTLPRRVDRVNEERVYDVDNMYCNKNDSESCVVCYDHRYLLPCNKPVCVPCLKTWIDVNRNACAIKCPSGCGLHLPVKLIQTFDPHWTPVFHTCARCNTATNAFNRNIYCNICVNCVACTCQVCNRVSSPKEAPTHLCDTLEDRGLLLLLRSKVVQMCDMCPAIIQRDGGCNRLVCEQCFRVNVWEGQ